MNEVAAIQAIYDVLNLNRATLIEGLSHGGVVRKIESLTRTVISVPTAYYAVAINCTGAREYAAPSRNIGKATSGIKLVEYSMIVQIADAAYPEQGEEESFLTAHNNFRKFSDRIAKLLRETRFFPNSSSTPRFCIRMDAISGIEMSKENINLIYEGTSVIVLTSWLRFTLMDPNSDSSLLYS